MCIRDTGGDTFDVGSSSANRKVDCRLKDGGKGGGGVEEETEGDEEEEDDLISMTSLSPIRCRFVGRISADDVDGDGERVRAPKNELAVRTPLADGGDGDDESAILRIDEGVHAGLSSSAARWSDGRIGGREVGYLGKPGDSRFTLTIGRRVSIVDGDDDDDDDGGWGEWYGDNLVGVSSVTESVGGGDGVARLLLCIDDELYEGDKNRAEAGEGGVGVFIDRSGLRNEPMARVVSSNSGEDVDRGSGE